MTRRVYLILTYNDQILTVQMDNFLKQMTELLFDHI